MRSQLIYFAALTVTMNFYILTSFAQVKWQSGLFLGGANYQGDLSTKVAPDLSKTGYAIGLINHYYLNPRLSIRNHIIVGKISGTDADAPISSGRRERNFSFESTVGEFALLMEWQPLYFLSDSTGGPSKFSPYIYSGLGLSRINASPSFESNSENGFMKKIEEDLNHESSVDLVVPIGGGIKMNVSSSFDLSLDVGARLNFNDYVDGISVSANPEFNDWYWFGGLIAGLRFSAKDSDKDGIIDKEDECPKDKGDLVTNGCPDADGDGVSDKKDLCPEVFGDLAYNGCPDSDGDTIVDVLDDCPNFAGPIDKWLSG